MFVFAEYFAVTFFFVQEKLFLGISKSYKEIYDQSIKSKEDFWKKISGFGRSQLFSFPNYFSPANFFFDKTDGTATGQISRAKLP